MNVYRHAVCVCVGGGWFWPDGARPLPRGAWGDPALWPEGQTDGERALTVTCGGRDAINHHLQFYVSVPSVNMSNFIMYNGTSQLQSFFTSATRSKNWPHYWGLCRSRSHCRKCTSKQNHFLAIWTNSNACRKKKFYRLRKVGLWAPVLWGRLYCLCFEWRLNCTVIQVF